MNPNPAKRPRPSTSPSPEHSSDTTGRVETSLSPSRPFLPRPSSSRASGIGTPLPPPSSILAGPPPSSDLWSSAWPPAGAPGYSRRSIGDRRSLGATSSGDPTSPKMEGIEEGQSTDMGLVFTRDVSNRAPRSMMACTRCRRQKMKCDGPEKAPCRGCRASGSTCTFESRSRPKSISVLPSRAPPFHAARPSTPSGAPGFYPAGALPAPPTLSRPPGPPAEAYATRLVREPMPPPPTTSISALTAPYPPPPSSRPISSPPPHPSLIIPTYHGPPMPLPPYSAPGPPRPHSPPSQEGRLRGMESSMRNLGAVPDTLHRIQHSIHSLQRTVDVLSNSLPDARARANPELNETIWEEYRTRAWPLTPWLVGLREQQGLPGLIVEYLGKRALGERVEDARRNSDQIARAIRTELGRLLGQTFDWAREDIRAAGVFATWTSDPALAALAVAKARTIGLDRIWSSRKTQDDWREWIYLSMMDHLCQLVNFCPSSASDLLAPAFKARISSVPGVYAQEDSGTRDRDYKLLAWLEYAETLAEVHESHRSLCRAAYTGREDIMIIADLTEIWRRYAGRWDVWAGTWHARSDPILSLHFNYALLCTTSPLVLGKERIWHDLARDPDGRALLDKARDAAMAVIQAVCSQEIGRTLMFSFALYRPILAQAILLLIHLLSSQSNSAPIVAPSTAQDVFKKTLDALHAARPFDMAPTGILGDIAERGEVAIAPLLGMEPGRELWVRLLG